jgi:hypothetical protein
MESLSRQVRVVQAENNVQVVEPHVRMQLHISVVFLFCHEIRYSVNVISLTDVYLKKRTGVNCPEANRMF